MVRCAPSHRVLTRYAVMELAAILALALREWVDAGIIVGILLLNAAVGW